MSVLFGEFQRVLKDKATPAFIKYHNETPEYLSAANIYFHVLKRIKYWYRNGLREGKTLKISPDPFNVIVDFMVCLKLKASYYPVAPTLLNAPFEILDTDSLELNLTTYSPLILNTSGTTNQKTYGLTEQGLMFQLNGHEEFFKQYPHNHKLSILPTFHCFGLILDYLLAIKMDKYISFMNKPSFFLKDIQKLFNEEIDFITGVPKQMELLVNFAKKDKSLASKLKECTFYFGGALLPEALKENAQNTFKNIIEGYGLTEAGPGVLMNGRPLNGIDLKIVNQKLCIKSPSLAQGLSLDDNYYQTQDIFIKSEGAFKLIGRDDEFVKSSNGKFSHFSEIETTIYKRFSADVQIVKIENRLVPVQISSGNEVNKSFWNWLKNNYPILESPKVVSSIKLEELMQSTKGKSRVDVLKAI